MKAWIDADGEGTTSACAENTSGDNPYFKGFQELPPRARRILSTNKSASFAQGTTSACAENTRGTVVSAMMIWNYLRVRGEYPK